MPVAWAQYLAERSLVDGSNGELPCPQSFLEILGRDSANIAMVELLRYHDKGNGQGYDSDVASARLLKRLKGVPDWNVGETRKAYVRGGHGSESPKVSAGSQLILFRGRGPSTEPCSAGSGGTQSNAG